MDQMAESENGSSASEEPKEGRDMTVNFDVDEERDRLTMFVPCLPAPKGSSRAQLVNIKGGRKCYSCGQQPKRITFLPGSGDSTKAKQDEQIRLFKSAKAQLWKAEPNWQPFNGPVVVNIDCIFDAPKHRLKEVHHTTYPDKDKLERMVLDCLGPVRVNKAPDLDQPYILSNDSQVVGGYTNKWWHHTWIERFPKQTFMAPEQGVLIEIAYTS